MEAAIGIVLLAMMILGGLRFSRNAIKSNSLGKDIAAASGVLKVFVEDARALNIDAIPRNSEIKDVSGPYTLRWRAYDNSSAGAYKQPLGLVLLCVKMTYQVKGVQHQQETSTLLGKE